MNKYLDDKAQAKYKVRKIEILEEGPASRTIDGLIIDFRYDTKSITIHNRDVDYDRYLLIELIAYIIYDPCVAIKAITINDLEYPVPVEDSDLIEILAEAMEANNLKVNISYKDHQGLEYEKTCLIFLEIPGYPGDYFIVKQLEN